VTPWVGRSLRRFEDPALITGAGRFVADLSDGAAFLRFVRSPLPRGRVISIDAPDDTILFTGQDLADVRPLRPLLHRADYRPVDQPILARDEVRFVGEPVAVVVADSLASAEDAADRVYLDIDSIDAVIDARAALTPDAPKVHESVPDNTLVDARFSTEGVDEAFAEAHEVIEFDLRSRRQSAMPLEARGSVAAYDERSGRITLTSSTQAPHVIRTIIADLIGLPESQLRVVAPDVGGAFGQKYCVSVEDIVAVWVARRLMRTVSWIEDRRENFMSAFHSRDHRYQVRGAFAEDGRLLAVDADLLCNVGAYSCYPVTSGVEPLMAMADLPGPYDLQRYRVRSRGIATNTCPMAPYRGVARPVITLAIERLMDLAAAKLDMTPVEIRRRNLIRRFPYKSVTGAVFDVGSYVEALERTVEKVDLDAFRDRQAAALAQGRYLGVGFSVFSERTGYGTPTFAARDMDVTPGYETVDVVMDPSGYVEARIGASPHGQGLATSMAQLLGDQLGVDPMNVTIVHGDTDRTPYGWGTFASRSMVIAGGAAHLAARHLRDKLARMAALELEASPEDIVLENGRAIVSGTDVGVDIPDLARIAYHRSQRLAPDETPGLVSRATYDPVGTFSNACHAAFVEVDVETGGVRLDRFVVVEDAGRLINPMIADGQVHGGVTQGIAGALLEEIIYDEDGNILTTSLMDYLPPTAAEVPEIEIYHLETISDATITGAKGLGEGGTIGAPAAVINAISDALRPLGVQVNEMPATPSRIRELIRARERASR
jgi:carbon-monoxide dehydrogenase large subunit